MFLRSLSSRRRPPLRVVVVVVGPRCVTSLAALRVGASVRVALTGGGERMSMGVAAWPLKKIGDSDRGRGLAYADDHPYEPQPEGDAVDVDEVFVVKVQAPLDSSSDAAGGIGRMTPTTLLLTDKHRSIRHLVGEDDAPHGPLLRAALRAPRQTAFLFAKRDAAHFLGAVLGKNTDLTVFLDHQPPEDRRW